MSSVRSDDGKGLMQGRFSHRATAATSGPPELKIQTETPAVSHEETPPLRHTPDWLHEIKYADRIAQGAQRAAASVRLARARAITLAHFRSHSQGGSSLIGVWYFRSRGSPPNSVISLCNGGVQRAAGLATRLSCFDQTARGSLRYSSVFASMGDRHARE